MADGPGKREQIAEVFARHERERLGPPSVRQIGEAVNLSSTSTVFVHLDLMVRAGVLEPIPQTGRKPQERRYRLVVPDGAPCPTCGHERAAVDA